jgi:predicted acyl esterase
MSLDVVAKRAIARRKARSVRVQTGVPVALRDGATLRADVYSPVAGGPHPCVLYRTPYGKTGRFGPIELAESIAARGYIVVVHNTGGNDWQEAELRTARQRVFHDANRASRVHFPTLLS